MAEPHRGRLTLLSVQEQVIKRIKVHLNIYSQTLLNEMNKCKHQSFGIRSELLNGFISMSKSLLLNQAYVLGYVFVRVLMHVQSRVLEFPLGRAGRAADSIFSLSRSSRYTAQRCTLKTNRNVLERLTE